MTLRVAVLFAGHFGHVVETRLDLVLALVQEFLDAQIPGKPITNR